MVTDAENTPKQVVPCPSRDICAAVFPVSRGPARRPRFAAATALTSLSPRRRLLPQESCTSAPHVHAGHTPTPGPAFSVEAALHTYRRARIGRASLLDPAPPMGTPIEPASAASGYPMPTSASSLPGKAYKRLLRAGV